MKPAKETRAAEGIGTGQVAAQAGALNEAAAQRRPDDRQPSGIPNRALLKFLTAGIPDNVVTDAIAQYQAGGTVSDAAAVLGLPWLEARAVLVAAAVHRRHDGRRRNTSEVTGSQRNALRCEVAARYRAGASLPGIAAALDRPDTLVRALLIEAGVALRPTSSGSRPRLGAFTPGESRTIQDQAVALHHGGATVRAIARTLRRSPVTIETLLEEAGVYWPRRAQLSDRQRSRLRAEVAARYQRGDPIRTIAADLGYSYGHIHNVLIDAAVPLRTRARRKQKRDETRT